MIIFCEILLILFKLYAYFSEFKFISIVTEQNLL